ncbi:hypothetical protein, partial [Salmonella sp. s54836]|uniref:hypothetical protein n=1 Tax=Salmonella sp. s54836 TaxID=3159673 RepID=UPI00397F32D3
MKFNEDSQNQNGLNDDDLNEDYCNCDSQANIINDTLQKLLAKKEQFYADCPTNSHDLPCY